MPLPPYHIGPGIALKGIGGGTFSFSVFVLAQVLLDLEPLVRILIGAERLHGFTNTLAGMLLVAGLCVVPGRRFCEWGLARLADRLRGLLPSLHLNTCISLRAAACAAVFGTAAHGLLDAVMHADARPGWPVTEANALHGTLSIAQLNGLCLVLAGAGLVLLALRWVLVRRQG